MNRGETMGAMIDGVEYNQELVDAFLKAQGKTDKLDLPQRWFGQHLATFKQGYDTGYAVASAECPDCGECDVHDKAAERGPPEGHHSQQDR